MQNWRLICPALGTFTSYEASASSNRRKIGFGWSDETRSPQRRGRLAASPAVGHLRICPHPIPESQKSGGGVWPLSAGMRRESPSCSCSCSCSCSIPLLGSAEKSKIEHEQREATPSLSHWERAGVRENRSRHTSSERIEHEQEHEHEQREGTPSLSHWERAGVRENRGRASSQTRPPSCRSSHRLMGSPPPKPPRAPEARMTRWQGTMMETGLAPTAWPTARAAWGEPMRRATSP